MAIKAIHKGKSRMFGGKRYIPAYACPSKREANSQAKRVRENYGQLARIISANG